MRLTSYTDYSLRVLMYLAAEPQRRATIAEIAAAFDISAHHLTKVVLGLARGSWLTTVRGPGGGLELALPPQRIIVGEVVRCAEGHDVPAACFAAEGPPCRIAPGCGLRSVLGEAVDAFYAVLDRHTLADLVRQPRALSKLLGTDRLARRPTRSAGAHPA